MATVFDYGAKGDGVTDDSAAFTAALNSSINGAGPVLIPAAKYAIASGINYTINTSSAHPWGFIGEGAVLISTITNGADVMKITCPVGNNFDVRYLQLVNFQIFGSGGFGVTGKEGNGINIIAQDGNTTAIYNCLFHQLTLDSLGGHGLVLDGNIFETSVIGCNFQRNTDGLQCMHDSNTIAGGGHEGICSSISVTDCMFIQNNRYGLQCGLIGPAGFPAASEVEVKGGYFRENGSNGALYNAGMSFGRGISNCAFENNCKNTAPGSPTNTLAHVYSLNDAKMEQCTGFLNSGGAMSLLSVYSFGKSVMRSCNQINEGGPAVAANMGFAFVDGAAGSIFLAYECSANLFTQAGTATNWRCYNCQGTAPSPQNNLNNTGTTGTI